MALWPHQEYSVGKFSISQIGIDASDPGTGKTRAHLAVYAGRRKPRGRLLIICPKTLMTSAWGNEIKENFPTLSYTLANANNRLEAFQKKTDVVIMNTDGVTTAVKNAAIMRLMKEFDHLIIDESSYFKHRGSQRSKAMSKISKGMKWRFLLSGTPNPNSVTELWHQALIMDGGDRLGNNFYKFQSAVQIPTQIGPQSNHLRWDDREGVQDEVYALLGDVMVRHDFEDVMTHVPANHKAYVDFELPKSLMKQYLALEATSLLELEKEVSAVHASSLRNKLLQLCSGAVYHGEGTYTVLDRGRYEMIADLVEARDHTVVFFNWKHQRDELIREFTKRDMYFAVIDGDTPDHERDEIVRMFQAGRYQALLLHPRTGAHGLTLTRGTTSIISSPFYEADMLKQAIHRIYRGGQTEVTNTLLIRATGTVEEFVYQRLNDKTVRMNDFLDLVRAAQESRK